MVSYNPLWKTLIDRGMKKTDLLKPPVSMGSSTLAKMGKDEYIALALLEKICISLDCSIQDVVEVRKD